MIQYRLVAFVSTRRQYRRCVGDTPVHISIAEVCRPCLSSLLCIATIAKRPRYFWVERHNHTILAKFSDKDAAEMAGYLLAGSGRE